MPGFNHTGPFSEGPLTGRGLGRCRRGARATDRWEVDEADFGGLGRRRRLRRCGGGGGRHWAGRSADEIDMGNRSDWLRRQTARLSTALAEIEAELGELESETKTADEVERNR
jgi:hypothetical protein